MTILNITKDTVILFKGKPYKDGDPKAKSTVPLIPLSLISLTPPLISSGYNIKIIDQDTTVEKIFYSIEELLNRVICIGISALTGNEISEGLKFSELIKKYNKNIPIIWGGWHVSILTEESIKNSYVDIIVKGLGQERFLNLVKCIESKRSLESVDGICYKSDNKIINIDENNPSKLDNCPLPAFDLLDLEYYRKHSLLLRHKPIINDIEITGYLYYVTSFGCPHECAYCCSNSVFGKKLYTYNIESVVDQIKWLVEEKKFNSISFMDANFFINIKRIELFCKLLLEKKVKFAWDAQMCVKDIIRYEKSGLLSLIKRSGCFRFNIGSESGSQEILDYIEKHINVTDILESARILTKHKIEAAYNFLFGLPEIESKRHIYESFDLARKLKEINPEFSFPISFYVPFPGTKMCSDAIKRGFKFPDNLEGWGMINTNYDSTSQDYPWKSTKWERIIYDVMTFYIPLAYPGNIYRGTITRLKEKIKSSRLRLFIKLGYYLAIFRLKYSFYHWPFEILVFKIYRFIKRAPDYSPGGKCDTVVN